MGDILAVGLDPALLYTRGLVLERTGASVKCAAPDAAFGLLSTLRVDLVVLCHSLSLEDQQRLVAQVRTCCAPAKTLLVRSSKMAAADACEADRHVAFEDGPHALMQMAKQLVESAITLRAEGGGDRRITTPTSGETTTRHRAMGLSDGRQHWPISKRSF